MNKNLRHAIMQYWEKPSEGNVGFLAEQFEKSKKDEWVEQCANIFIIRDVKFNILIFSCSHRMTISEVVELFDIFKRYESAENEGVRDVMYELEDYLGEMKPSSEE